MKSLATILAWLAATTIAHAADLWQPVVGDVSFAPTTLTTPTYDTRRVLMKIGEAVALFEYDCTERTAAMLYVVRPGRDPYVPVNNAPQQFVRGSAHSMVYRWACRGLV